MKIDYSKHKTRKNSTSDIEEADSELTHLKLEETSVNQDSPVWKSSVDNENSNQMDEKVSEESPQTVEKENELQQECMNAEALPGSQSETDEKQCETEIQKTVSVTSQTDPETQEGEPIKEVEGEQSSELIPVLQSDQNESQPLLQSKLHNANIPQSLPQLEHTRRIVVKHSILGNKVASHDPNVLVESTTFTSLGKIQPFLISISTNAALVMDYHCHLTTSEVVGYLAGSWDINTHSLAVTQAYPCKCRLGDYESAPNIEAEIRKTIKANGLTVVGWYHSHPTAPPTPTIRDVETQLDYELRMKGTNDSSYLPCIGFICSPYNLDNPTLESNIVSYWVVPPPENKIHEYGKPMMMSYSVIQDQSIPLEVLQEMKNCADFYKPESDYIKFKEIMKGSVTFLEKLKVSLTPKFPLNHQKSEMLWNLIRHITDSSIEKEETEIVREMVEISSTPSVTPPPSVAAHVPDKPKFNMPTAASSLAPLGYKASPNPVSSPNVPTFKPHARTKTPSSSVSSSSTSSPSPSSSSSSSSTTTSKRSNSRDTSKNLASLSNYFVGSDLAALFNSAKFPGLGLDPATKSLLNLNSLSLGGMFLPPMAAAAAAAAAAASYKTDPGVGLMKPPPPPPTTSYYQYGGGRSGSGSRSSPGSASSSPSNSPSSSRSLSRGIPSTSRDTMPPPPPNKVPKLDVHQMANFFIPSNLGKNCTITTRPSGSTSTNK